MKSLREHSKARSNAKIAKYMKGGAASNCYASGGTVKAVAAKKREDMPAVEGKAARPRLDRPGRRLRRADGGPTISADSKREAERLRSAATRDNVLFGLSGLAATGAGAVAAVPKRIPGITRLGGAAAAAYNAHTAAQARGDRERNLAEADRIERGQAEPGKEDRKKGGRVKK